MPNGSPARASLEEPSSVLQALIRDRLWLIEFVRAHHRSVNYFASATGFFKTAQHRAQSNADDEAPPPGIEVVPQDGQLSGITSGFTCFESLSAAFPAPNALQADTDTDRFERFRTRCLRLPDQWESEGAAERYCIVRGIGGLLNWQGDLPLEEEQRLTLVDLIENRVWALIGHEPYRRGVYETPKPAVKAGATNGGNRQGDGEGQREGADRVDRGGEAVEGGTHPATSIPPRPPYAYPPNAFLTYWALLARRKLFPTDDEGRTDADDIVESWLQSVIGQELALLHLGSREADPQQLLWAICGLVIGRETPLAERQDGTAALVRAGIEAFFAEQGEDGSWATGRALFHYPEAGNAYCYIYETLAEALALTLGSHAAALELRRLFMPHLDQLMMAARRLEATKRPLGGSDRRYGWTSGHHPHRTSPESWATASAFRFLQGLRRLVGMEVRRRAGEALGLRAPAGSLNTLGDRGKTWAPEEGEEAGNILRRLFVEPIRGAGQDSDTETEPDREIMGPAMARAAILFGPPGTGKTTLVDAVAGALDWDFVEITPADFLNEGVELVSARADQIFNLIMQLDRCVILLDEIDELIRSRGGTGESLSRFFTTTMLPRLARLWKQAKVLFFVNTNSISDVDPAIQRSQRFDAAVFVMPPNFEKKAGALGSSLPGGLTKVDVERVFDSYRAQFGFGNQADVQGVNPRCGWLPFLTYDQIHALASEKPATESEFYSRLAEYGQSTLTTDWREPSGEEMDDNKLEDPLKRVIWLYDKERAQQRIDALRDPAKQPPTPPAG